MSNEQGRRQVKKVRTGDRGDTRSGTATRSTESASAARRSARAGGSPARISGATAFFVALVVFAMLKAVLMRHVAVGGWHLFSAVFLEGAFILLILGVFDLIAPRRNYWVDLFGYGVLSVVMLVLSVYVSFYSQLFDPSMMAMAGQLGTVSAEVKELIKPAYALFLIDIPFFAVWAYFLQRADRAQRALDMPTDLTVARSRATVSGNRRPSRRSRPVAVLVVLSAVIFATQLFYVHQLPSWIDGVAVARARGLSVAQSAIFLPQSDATELNDSAQAGEVDAPVPGGAQPTSTLTTAAATPGGKAEARIERIRGSLDGTRVAPFPVGAFRGKNVIIIQVEALNTFLMQKKYNGQEITPNLNKLIGESWYFPNTYSETGIGNTADAEFTVNSSLYSPRTQAASVAYANRVVPGLPSVLRGMGYYTFTIHQNKVLYWNRKQMYEGLGFNRYYDFDFFHSADMMGEMGSSDEELFKRGTKVVRALETSGTPFYSQFITLSAHSPFEFTPESRRPLKTPPDLEGSLMGKYISAESYSDLAIGQFIDTLKATKLWDNSIIIIYGDHTAMLENKLTGANALGAAKLLGRAYGPADRQRIPLIIHLPKQKTPVVRQDVVGQVDVMPTVADLVGADLTQIPHMGRSVFVGSNSLVPLNTYLPGGTFINNSVVFMPGLGFDDGSAVKVADNTPADPTDREKQDFQRSLELTRISDQWVKSLPLRKNVGEMGWIPDPVARKAAKPYGALQQGIGSKKKQ